MTDPVDIDVSEREHLAVAEQAALRRIATLIAADKTTTEVCGAVVEEVVRVLGLPAAWLLRYEAERAMTVLAVINDAAFPVGSRWPLDGSSVPSTVFETGLPARIDDYSNLTGSIAARTRESGFLSSLGVPILIDGRVWGAIYVGTVDPEPLPADTEARLAHFTDLVAIAISNAASRDRLRLLAEEQAALRRVATLVAEGVNVTTLFDAVCVETAELVGASVVNLSHYTPEGLNVQMAGWSLGGRHVPVGTTFPLAPDTVGGQIVRTKAPVRMDSWEGASSELARLVRELGIRSSVGAPIMVDGQLWGALVASNDTSELLPTGTEFRLARFAELIATAVSNATARSELLASRARIVAAGDEVRRRIERNLHDGTQQRLLAIGLDLQRIEASAASDQHALREGLERVRDDLESVLQDVRELSRGLHAPILSRRGLRPAVLALTRQSPIPVEVDIDLDLDQRPPEAIETAVYYAVSEALTNAIKHSNASGITVTIAEDDTYGEAVTHLHATVADDGDGGAVPTLGSGLIGLADRIDALGGRFTLDSPAGHGTTISIVLPLTPPA